MAHVVGGTIGNKRPKGSERAAVQRVLHVLQVHGGLPLLTLAGGKATAGKGKPNARPSLGSAVPWPRGRPNRSLHSTNFPAAPRDDSTSARIARRIGSARSGQASITRLIQADPSRDIDSLIGKNQP